ncbi:MAG: hypothetical protein NVSMB5_11820 [Candidatus Velthaea sp.]
MSLFARLRLFAWNAAPATPFAAGVAALERRRVSEALALFDAALGEATSAGERAAIHNKRGIAFVQAGDIEAAVHAFLAALEIESHVPAIVNIGNLLLEAGDVEEAIVHYEAALRLDDDYATAHLNLGVAYKRIGRRSEAVREFRRANRLEGRLKRGG